MHATNDFQLRRARKHARLMTRGATSYGTQAAPRARRRPIGSRRVVKALFISSFAKYDAGPTDDRECSCAVCRNSCPAVDDQAMRIRTKSSSQETTSCMSNEGMYIDENTHKYPRIHKNILVRRACSLCNVRKV